MKDLNRRESVVLGLLHAYGKEILRTKLVKMTYLLDNLHFEQVGKTMTGYDYHWDYYGPNAVGNAIVDTLSKLRTKGLVSDTQKLTSFETFANYYRVMDVDPEELELNDSDWLYIHGIVKRYGPMTRQRVVAESKKALPMQGVNQFDILKFTSNPNNERLREAFFEDKDFVRMTTEAMSGCHEKISLDELRAEVTQSAMV